MPSTGDARYRIDVSRLVTVPRSRLPSGPFPRHPLRRRAAIAALVVLLLAPPLAALIPGRQPLAEPTRARASAGPQGAAPSVPLPSVDVDADRARRPPANVVVPHVFAWPVRPFHRAHPLRATFGEPRALLGLGLPLQGAARAVALNRLDQIATVGHRSLHTGVDIVASDGTPVYAVAPGIARTNGAGYETHVSVGPFEYWHLADAVPTGTVVTALRTEIGQVYTGQGHVHLTRLDTRGWPINPLTDGGLTPYRDTAAPRIAGLSAFRPDGSRIALRDLSGPVALAVNAYDLQSAGGLETGLYRLTWTMTRLGAAPPGVGPLTLFRFDTLPSESIGQRLYTVGSTRHSTHPHFWYRLTTEPRGSSRLLTGDLLQTEALRPGRYRLEVAAADARDNRVVRSFLVAVVRPAPAPPADVGLGR